MDNRPVALITGCSHPSSLGAALLRQLVKRGWKVFASALVLESMQALADDGCMTLVFDVTKEKDIQAAKSTIGSRLDLLINNAAVVGLGPLLDTDHRKMEEMFRINVFAPLAIIQAFSDTIIASRGCIVNIGSVGVYGLPFHGIYASSKAALQVMSDVLRREMAPFKVTVITVELAMVMTAMLRAEDPFDLNLQSTQRSTAFEKWYTEIQPKYRQDLEKRSKDAMSASVAAETIIKRVTQRREGKIWVGTMAWIFRVHLLGT